MRAAEPSAPMTGGLLLVDTLLRGMTVGAQALIALAFLSRWPVNWRRGLGAAFVTAAGCYMINTSPPLSEAVGPLIVPIGVLSIIAPVIFWWFSQSLFDDGFRVRWLAVTPLLLVAPLAVFHFTGVQGGFWDGAFVLSRAVMIGAFGHAIFSALRFLNDDLIEGRRRFRVIFAVAVGVTGFIINYSETVGFRDRPPDRLLIFQAASILLMTLGFGVWLVTMRGAVLDGAGGPGPKAAPVLADAPAGAADLRPVDRPAYDRLMERMAAGDWREEGLSVAALAEKVGMPEHQLRALINGQLGYRNFTAFLNSFRLPAAQALLADPMAARRQVLQIALDVGFGSIAPFNRAFKEATGETPTQYRRRMQGAG